MQNFGTLKPEDYKTILDFEMPSEELNCLSVYTIRSFKIRSDDKEKNEYFEWEGVPELNYD